VPSRPLDDSYLATFGVENFVVDAAMGLQVRMQQVIGSQHIIWLVESIIERERKVNVPRFGPYKHTDNHSDYSMV
jgi:hypothetical protein